MTIHYHGTPITPLLVLSALAGRHFCVSFAAPAQVAECHRVGQSVMLDNGAFSFWRTGKPTDWTAFYRWSERWLDYRTTWAVIPDVIDGGVSDNDTLIAEWPHGQRGAPVWHMHEPIGRLEALCDKWDRVCIGSSAQYAVVGSEEWRRRMDAAMNTLCKTGSVPAWLHMLRGMQCSEWGYPFASVDSTDIARNHGRAAYAVDGKRTEDAVAKCCIRAREMADRWDSRQCPARWERRAEQLTIGSVYANSDT